MVEPEIAIFVVALDRMPGVSKVHANLVRSSGEQTHLQHAVIPTAFQRRDARQRLASAFSDAYSPLTLRGDVLVQRRTDFEHALVKNALYDGHIDLLHLAFAQHAMQLDQGAALFGEDQQSRSVAIEPVRKLEHLRLRPGGAQRLDHAIADAAAAVHRNAGRLVDHQQGGVLVDHRELQRLRDWSFPFRNPDRGETDAVAGFQPIAGLYAPAVHPHLAAAQHAVHMTLRHAFQPPQQKIVDALRGAFLADLEPGCPRLA